MRCAKTRNSLAVNATGWPSKVAVRAERSRLTLAQLIDVAGAIVQPANLRAHACQKLFEVKRLHQIVVGAGVKALDLLSRLFARRDDDDWRPVALGAQPLEHGKSAQLRHAKIKQNARICLRGGGRERFLTVLGPSDGMAFPA